MTLPVSAQPAEWTHAHEEIRKMLTLRDASRALMEVSDFNTGLQRVLETLSRHHGAVRSSVAILNEQTRQPEFQASLGGDDQDRPGPGGLGNGQGALKAGRPMIVPHMAPRPQNGFDRLTYISVPIVSDDRRVGELGIEMTYRPNRDYEGTVTFLEVVSAMIAQASRMHRLIAADRQQLLEENAHLRLELNERYGLSNLVGASRTMNQLYSQIMQVAKASTTVLLRGESGTGKELIAHAIHHNSLRAKKPFIRVSCAALPNDLIESELFGYEKGAFTGAHAAKKGRFDLADGGTLFLDEIGELNLATQVKLLRVLQEREFERLGGTETIRTDIRLVAATNKDLEKAIAAGTFREDLYYRLNVFAIFVPPLRERKTDVPQLADFFLEKYSRQHGKKVKRIATPAIDMLMAYHWPGNVRELENAIERAVVVCTGQVLHGHHLPATLQTAEASGTTIRLSLDQATAAFEKDILQDALKSARGNRAKAARMLQTTGRIFNYKVRKYGINWKRFR